MGTIQIVTERLRLRPFQVEDLEAFVAYRGDLEVARYQSWDRTYSMADAESFLSSQGARASGLSRRRVEPRSRRLRSEKLDYLGVNSSSTRASFSCTLSA